VVEQLDVEGLHLPARDARDAPRAVASYYGSGANSHRPIPATAGHQTENCTPVQQPDCGATADEVASDLSSMLMYGSYWKERPGEAHLGTTEGSIQLLVLGPKLRILRRLRMTYSFHGARNLWDAVLSGDFEGFGPYYR